MKYLRRNREIKRARNRAVLGATVVQDRTGAVGVPLPPLDPLGWVHGADKIGGNGRRAIHDVDKETSRRRRPCIAQHRTVFFIHGT